MIVVENGKSTIRAHAHLEGAEHPMLRAPGRAEEHRTPDWIPPPESTRTEAPPLHT